MDTPPPYYESSPKKSKTGLIVGLIIGGVLLCCVLPIVGLGGLGLWGMGKMKGTLGCTFTVTNVGYALKAYEHDHNGKLPNAKTWQNDLKSYYKDIIARPDQKGNPFPPAPADGNWGCSDDSGGFTGLAFNDEFSGKKLDSLNDAHGEVAIFEVSKVGMNLHEPYKPQPYNLSPQTLGKRRGWYVIKADGNMALQKEGVKLTLISKSARKINPIKTRNTR